MRRLTILMTICLLLLIATGCSSKPNQTDLFSVKFSGENGNGVAIITETDATGYADADDLANYANAHSYADVLYSAAYFDQQGINAIIDYQVEPDSNLSNGDIVTINPVIGSTIADQTIEDFEQQFKIQLPKNIQVTVSGLQ